MTEHPSLNPKPIVEEAVKVPFFNLEESLQKLAEANSAVEVMAEKAAKLTETLSQ